MASIKKRVREYSTRSLPRSGALDHVAPHLGALPVKALTWHQVTLWTCELRTNVLSHTSIANIHGLLSAAMNAPFRLGYGLTARARPSDSASHFPARGGRLSRPESDPRSHAAKNSSRDTARCDIRARATRARWVNPVHSRAERRNVAASTSPLMPVQVCSSTGPPGRK